MTEVVSFINVTPAIRFDAVPWTDVQIEEAPAIVGPWTVIDTLALSPVDGDPENPAARSFTTTLGTADDLWYRVRFLDGSAGFSEPSLPFLNSANLPTVSAYSDTTELARVLKIRQPTAAQVIALQRVLDTAALEIDAEVGNSSPYDDPPALVVEVNLERAVEHWQQQEAAFGIIGLGGNEQALYVARDSWDRHAHKLAPLKLAWGLA